MNTEVSNIALEQEKDPILTVPIYYGIFSCHKGMWTVRFPDAPSTHAQEHTLNKAIAVATNALSLVVKYRAKGQRLFKPREYEEIVKEAQEGDLVFPVVVQGLPVLPVTCDIETSQTILNLEASVPIKSTRNVVGELALEMFKGESPTFKTVYQDAVLLNMKWVLSLLQDTIIHISKEVLTPQARKLIRKSRNKEVAGFVIQTAEAALKSLTNDSINENKIIGYAQDYIQLSPELPGLPDADLRKMSDDEAHKTVLRMILDGTWDREKVSQKVPLMLGCALYTAYKYLIEYKQWRPEVLCLIQGVNSKVPELAYYLGSYGTNVAWVYNKESGDGKRQKGKKNALEARKKRTTERIYMWLQSGEFDEFAGKSVRFLAKKLSTKIIGYNKGKGRDTRLSPTSINDLRNFLLEEFDLVAGEPLLEIKKIKKKFK